MLAPITVEGAVRLRRARGPRSAERRLRAGHRWIYSNEIDHPEPRLDAGALVRVEDPGGRPLATAAYHPNALIAGRVWGDGGLGAVTEALLAARLAAAAARRAVVAAGWQAHRLVHAEADELPGLVVDRYGPLAVVQSTSALADRLVEPVAELLRREHGCDAVLLRNDARGRVAEGLEREVRTLVGEVPETVRVDEAGGSIGFAPAAGQKTGLFLDMRACRDRVLPWLVPPGAGATRVLELFGYVGVLSVRAALAGAGAVVCVDSSADACMQARDNAAVNGVGDRVTVHTADARGYLKALAPASFDAVICDPPSLIQRKRDLRAGSDAFRRINYVALRALRPGGVFVTANCSHHLDEARMGELVASAAARGGRQLRRVAAGGASPDHPVLPGHPQSAYLAWQAYLVDGAPRGH